MNIQLELILRLFVAGLLGALIGLDRELHAKDAGLRTHFLVSIGSALFMIISQWGFQDGDSAPGARTADASRVAAQIVSGIGFLGAGTIMIQRQYVRGLTTAAGMWVSAGIGMAVGGGMYLLGCIATLLAWIGLYCFPLLFSHLRMHRLSIDISADSREHWMELAQAMPLSGYKLLNCTLHNSETTPGKVDITLVIGEHIANDDESHLITFIGQFPGISIEKIE